MDKEPKAKKKRTLLLFGLILLFGGFAVNTTFVYLGVLGYLRELTRSLTIVGLVLTLIGLVQVTWKVVNRKKK